MKKLDLINFVENGVNAESERKTKKGSLKNKSIYTTKNLIKNYVVKNIDMFKLDNVNALNYGVVCEMILKGLLFGKYNFKNNGVDFKSKDNTYEIKSNPFGNCNLDFNTKEKVNTLLLWFNDMVYEINYNDFINYLKTLNTKNVITKNDIMKVHLNYTILNGFKNKKVIMTLSDIK